MELEVERIEMIKVDVNRDLTQFQKYTAVKIQKCGH